MMDTHKADGLAVAATVNWGAYLVWFFRTMAVFQLVKGIIHWAMLLGIGDGASGPFAEDSLSLRAATIYFAVIDPVAGVGLWLTSSWGSVLWLLAAASQIAVCLGFPDIYGRLWLLVLVECAAMAGYVYLTMMVAETGEDVR